MDDNLSRAVREVFVRLYEEGLIYRGNYIVNWCPRCETAISDLEVKHEEWRASCGRFGIRWWGRTNSLRWRPRGPRRCWAIPPSQ